MVSGLVIAANTSEGSAGMMKYDLKFFMLDDRVGRLGVGRIGVGRIGVGRIGVGRIGVGRLGVGRLGVGILGVGRGECCLSLPMADVDARS